MIHIVLVRVVLFFNGRHHPGGSFDYWAHVTLKANVLSTNTSHTWINFVFTNHRGQVHFNGESTAKSPCWLRVSNRWPSDPDLLWFAPIPSLHDLAIFMVPHGQAPDLWGTTLQHCELINIHWATFVPNFSSLAWKWRLLCGFKYCRAKYASYGTWKLL